MANPPSLVLCWLAPANQYTLNCMQSAANLLNTRDVPGHGRKALPVAVDKDDTPTPLLTLGHEGDVKLYGPEISRIQFQFQLHPDTREIILRDTSTHRNTKVVNTTDPASLYFSSADGIPRQVVVRHNDQIIVSVPGENNQTYLFAIIWPPNKSWIRQALATLVQNHAHFVTRYNEIPSVSVTQYKTPAPQSRCEAQGTNEPWLHRKIRPLGIGTFGRVYQTVNMHTGEHFAVKVVKRGMASSSDSDLRRMANDEVNILKGLDHVSTPSEHFRKVDFR